MRYIEQLQKYDVDYGEASIEDEYADTVRVMTIHKSKGLEFPVVITAGMGKRFNMQDARSAVALHAGMGVGLDAVNLEYRTKIPSIIKKSDTKGGSIRESRGRIACIICSPDACERETDHYRNAFKTRG